ncbi:centrosomal protein of 120 kDa isoform X1 [Diachasma alloeum]|uniref:centrosomal protein of 120 kDa isoform X1 n=1 Tax=Diachasma alloeum TaxID=454923 RepID=UPI00073833A0|nr:centrosomal protein of 120 kDa isoform X1 [Diachasma alloeum]
MEQLVGSSVQVVLSLKEGKGFDKVANPTSIIATLNGLSLETDLISPEGNPVYATDLVWEATKTTLRKMRSGQEPLKLECIEFKENGVKEKIGYLLLSLRSAQIVPRGNESTIKTDWHRLLGLRNDVKGDKPEFSLSLTIEDMDTREVGCSEMMQKLSVTTDHQNPLNDSPKYLRSGHETDCTSKMNHFSNFEIPQERPGNKITHSCSEKDCTKSVEAYHCYCLHVTLNTVTLQSESIKNIEFRFHHPKAEVMSTLYPRMPVRMGETLRLQDIGCKFHFISSVEEIKHLLVAYPPRISIRDEEKIEKSCLGQAILDVKRILSDSKLKCQYEAVLFDSSRHEIGYVQVQMHLEDHGPYYRTTKSSWSENLGPPVLDDSLASKIVDELETWKERQQEMFKVELQRKEERHLNLLSDEWQRRRESLESQLACSVEQCKILASNLNKATDDLRTRRIQSMEKEAQLMKANEELKWTCDRKLRDLNDASERMREDYTSKLSRLEEEKKTFEEQISELRHENNRLQKIVSKQNEELMKYQKGSLTSEQTENLLQQMQSLEDKFESTMKSKTFFKEQWGKAVREIHKLKMEHQQALEVQIKSSREELKNIDLEQLLQADSAALSNDKLLLDEIQREINVIKPKPSYTINPEEFNSLYECSSRSNMDYGRRQHSKESSQQEERLRKLIEERDTLLKTGSYSTDDAIIIRLNSEIRSLLVSR